MTVQGPGHPRMRVVIDQARLTLYDATVHQGQATPLVTLQHGCSCSALSSARLLFDSWQGW